MTTKTLYKLAIVLALLPGFCQAQVRPNINSFTSAQRTQLVNAMMEYIDATSVQKHCIHVMTTGGHIHSDFDFLPFHRVYLEGMEDYIQSKGPAYAIYIPLPKWDPSTVVPTEFQVVDPDCASISCDAGHPASSCGTAVNWNPGIAQPGFLSLPVQAGINNDLCDWNMNPTAPSTANCCSNGLSRVIEGQGPNPVSSTYHNSVHGTMGGIMGNFRSPAAPIFWLWHAFVDDVWKTWECGCPQSGMAGTFDLYMKDTDKEVESERDRGEEPNIDNGPMWESEDIWVRNQNDGFTNQQHQNPEYMALPGNFNYVYVQVRNRGCIANAGTEMLELSWAKAGTALSWPSFWNGSITSPALMGNLISTQPIPVIQPGGSAIIEFAWQPPNPAIYAPIGTDPIFWANEPWHFCLLARILTPADPMTFVETTNLYANVKNNNNIIWKNLTVVDLNPANIVSPGGGWITDAKNVGAIIRVGDAWDKGGVYNLELQNPPTYRGNPVTAEAEVKVILDEPLWRIWQAGGYQGTNVGIANANKREIVVKNSPASLNNLRFRPNEQYLAHVGFHFIADRLSGQQDFYFQALQRNTLTKELVGGEKFHIKVPGKDRRFVANAGTDLMVSRYSKVNLSAIDIGQPATYNWYDEAGKLIHSGKELSVSADVSEKYKLEVIAKRDGVKDYDVVEVKVKPHEIVAISPNPANNNVLVKYKLSDAKSAYLMLQRPYASIQNQYILNLSQSQTTINVSGLAKGTYSVILVCDGTATDVKSLVVQ